MLRQCGSAHRYHVGTRACDARSSSTLARQVVSKYERAPVSKWPYKDAPHDTAAAGVLRRGSACICASGYRRSRIAQRFTCARTGAQVGLVYIAEHERYLQRHALRRSIKIHRSSLEMSNIEEITCSFAKSKLIRANLSCSLKYIYFFLFQCLKNISNIFVQNKNVGFYPLHIVSIKGWQKYIYKLCS